jgi:signal transduction histidine kinase
VTTTLLAAALVCGIGGVILWANPDRRVNRLVSSCSFHGGAWLAFLHITLTAHVEEGLYWLRFTSAVGALIPIHLLYAKEEISGELDGRGVWKGKVWWILSSLFLMIVPFTEWFIPGHSKPDQRIYGAGYYTYIAGLLVLYSVLLWSAYRQLKRVSGVKRLELQVWLGGGSAAAVSIVGLMGASAILHEPSLIRIQPLIILVFFGVTAFSITSGRVFDAKHLLIIGGHRLVLVLLVAGVGYGADVLFALFVPSSVAWVATAAVALWFAAELEKVINNVLLIYPRASEARSKAYEIAMEEVRTETLEREFLKILSGWSQSAHGLLVVKGDDGLRSGGQSFEMDASVYELLRTVRWATPERLQRERSSASREELRLFLETHKLGALVLREGSTVDVLVGSGVRATRRPFTYPEVQQMFELASIFQTALARASLWTKAQRAEQLATVGVLGASVAHEIRNPLVSIKTFVQLFPIHYMDESFRVRFSRLIGSEVARIERLTEQLLDLASPRKYEPDPVSLHEVVKSSLELVYSKAEDKKTEIITEFEASPDIAFTDANASKQVILNLCFNAIQAQESQERPRWVRLTTRNVDQGLELVVSDHGPGIAPEIRSRLFEAFQTTKSSGFGLGLAICSEILSSLGASISVDPFAPGQGATFRVVFPCPPRSS